MGRLRELLRNDLLNKGIVLDDATLQRSVDVARLLTRYSSQSDILDAAGRAALERALADQTPLNAAARASLLKLVLMPRFKGALSPADLKAFAWRCGDAAALRLGQEQVGEMDLPGYQRAYGPDAAFKLLESLIRVAAADGEIDDQQSRMLQRAAEALGVDGVLVSALFRRYDPRYAAGDLTFRLVKDHVTVGRATTNDVIIVDPQVALHHCTFKRTEDGWRVFDAGSGRPVLVNGEPAVSAPVGPSTQIRLGPWSLQLIGNVLKAYGHRRFSSLSARRLDRQIGVDVTLLEDVEFTVFSGEVIAMVGPSGCGKTTLINAIAGIFPADSGDVVLDGEDFHAILRENPVAIGIVPQDDLVHPELRVEESLYYAGRLRLPDAVSSEEIRAQRDRVLEELGVEHIRGSRIGDAARRGISGGQRKRVNLGQELMTRSTRIVFLDEPTSGLDPRSAQDIVRQIRQLVDEHGRIAFLVTHDLSPGILNQVDHLMVMVPGGRIAFFGPPGEASEYFGVRSPDLLFDKLGEHTPEQWAAKYRESPWYQTYVATRELLVRGLEVAPAIDTSSFELHPLQPAEPVSGRSGFLTQLQTLIARYTQIKLRDRSGLGVLLLQPLLLALFIWMVFPVPTPRLIFMVSLSCLWFGMSLSVRELISDRTIWRRERKVGVGVTPHLLSKVLVLGIFVAVQCGIFTTVIQQMMGLGDYGYGILHMAGAGALTGFTGASLGLLVSSLNESSEAAVGTLPLLLIPQICFSSVMVSQRDMGPLAKGLTWLTIERYALDLFLKVGAQLEEPTRVAGKWSRKSVTGPLYDLGLKGASADDMGLAVPVLIGALFAFSALFLVSTWIVTWWDRR